MLLSSKALKGSDPFSGVKDYSGEEKKIFYKSFYLFYPLGKGFCPNNHLFHLIKL